MIVVLIKDNLCSINQSIPTNQSRSRTETNNVDKILWHEQKETLIYCNPSGNTTCATGTHEMQWTEQRTAKDRLIVLPFLVKDQMGSMNEIMTDALSIISAPYIIYTIIIR